LDKDTYQGIKDNKHLLEHIAVERIASELDKLLHGDHTSSGIQLLVETEISHYIPGLQDKKTALLELSALPIQSLLIDEKWALFSHLLQKGEKEIKQFFIGLRFSNKRVQHIVNMTRWLKERSINSWSIESVYASGKETALQVEKIYQLYDKKVDPLALDKLQAIIEVLPIHSLTDVKVSGSDLIEWKHKKAGPWVKAVLKEIEMEILHGRLENNNEDIKEWVTRCSLN
jgi:tRNA nucleotidyltransferase (CCA-adding enzyme)